MGKKKTVIHETVVDTLREEMSDAQMRLEALRMARPTVFLGPQDLDQTLADAAKMADFILVGLTVEDDPDLVKTSDETTDEESPIELGNVPPSPETLRNAENAKYHSDGYDSGWNDALDAVLEKARLAGYSGQAHVIIDGLRK